VAPGGPWTASGCERCNRTGYRGRAPLAEFLPCSADTAQALREGLTSRELAARLGERRTATLRAHGLARLAAGETTAAELSRVLGGEARGTHSEIRELAAERIVG
jgi:type II secretory ATPase GspE/PulE/Tfp pilus assembly ATPase PilB-like protein